MTHFSTVFGFDFGERRIGVAIGQAITGTARGLATLHNKNSKPDWDAINRLLTEWRPDALIVGLPLHMDGTEQPMTDMARRFGNQLHGRFHLPVYHIDERLTSHEAEQMLDELHGAGRYDKDDIDQLAAQLLLQSWLDKQRQEGGQKL